MAYSSAWWKSYAGLSAAFLLLVVLPGLRASDLDNGKGKTTPTPQPVRALEPTYKVQAGLDGEIFPVFANYASLQKPQQRKWATVTVTISNHTDAPLRQRVAVQVPGWSDQEIQVAELKAGETRALLFAPTFLPRFYANHEIAAATAFVRLTDTLGRSVHATTIPVRLRAAQDIYWGENFEYAQFIASWVTPHDARVQRLLARAKEFAPGRRLPGYEEWKNADQQALSTYAQAKAIYRALQVMGLSYVKSSATFGQHQEVSERVRLPRETLRDVSANCIDGAVMWASLFENLGMEPEVVLVPGHAYVGVRLAANSNRYLYLDTALTARASFAAAAKAAERGLARYRPDEITRIPIAQARRAGIYPMPVPARAETAALHRATAGSRTAATSSR